MRHKRINIASCNKREKKGSKFKLRTQNSKISPNRLRRLGNLFTSMEEKQKAMENAIDNVVVDILPTYMKKEILSSMVKKTSKVEYDTVTSTLNPSISKLMTTEVEGHKHDKRLAAKLDALEETILIQKLLRMHNVTPSTLCTSLSLQLLERLCLSSNDNNEELKTILYALVPAIYKSGHNEEPQPYFQAFRSISRKYMDLKTRFETRNELTLPEILDSLKKWNKSELEKIMKNILTILSQPKNDSSENNSAQAMGRQLLLENMSEYRRNELLGELLFSALNDNHLDKNETEFMKIILKPLSVENKAFFVSQILHLSPFIENEREKLNSSHKQTDHSKASNRKLLISVLKLVTPDIRHELIDILLTGEHKWTVFKNISEADKKGIFLSLSNQTKQKLVIDTITQKPQLFKGQDFPMRLSLLPGENIQKAILKLLNDVSPKVRAQAVQKFISSFSKNVKFVTIGRLIDAAMKEDLDKSNDDQYSCDDAECTDAIVRSISRENRAFLLSRLILDLQQHLITKTSLQQDGSDNSFRRGQGRDALNVENYISQLYASVQDSNAREKILQRLQHVEERMRGV